MRLFHGTDKKAAIKAWKNHRLRASMKAHELATLDGCEDWKDYFNEDDPLVSLSQFRSTAERYAKAALIEIEVDEDEVYQTASDEYMMKTTANYEVISVYKMDGSTFTMKRLDCGLH